MVVWTEQGRLGAWQGRAMAGAEAVCGTDSCSGRGGGGGWEWRWRGRGRGVVEVG